MARVQAPAGPFPRDPPAERRLDLAFGLDVHTEASPPEPTILESVPSRRITVLRLWPGRRFNPRISA